MRRAGRNVSSRIGASRHRLRTATTCLLASGLLAGVIVPVEAADLPAQSAKQTLSGKEPPAKAAKKKKKKKKACPKAGAAKKKKKKKTCPTKPAPRRATPTPPPTDSAAAARAAARRSRRRWTRRSPPRWPTRPSSSTRAAIPSRRGSPPGTIDEQRVAVLRGRVIDRNGAPLAGVTVAILDHPELGSTETRSDGALRHRRQRRRAPGADLREGRLPADRAAPRDAVAGLRPVLDDVAMIPLDSAATTIESNGGGLQVARSSVSTDPQGAAGTTMIFKPGTTATDRRSRTARPQPLPGPWTVRATEYTVGDIGPQRDARRAAADLGLHLRDRALDRRGGRRRRRARGLLQPGLGHTSRTSSTRPWACDMPSGYHARGGRRALDRRSRRAGDEDGRRHGRRWPIWTSTTTTRATREPAPSWRPSGSTPPSAPSSPSSTARARSSGGCRRAHFSEVDHNIPLGLPPGARPPPNERLQRRASNPRACGSIISCEDQTLRERLPVNGTPFSLFYASDRVPGPRRRDHARRAGDRADDPPRAQGHRRPGHRRGPPFGEQFYEAAPAAISTRLPEFEPNLHWEIPWDGTDIYGRPVQGKVPILVRRSTTSTRRFATPPTQESINSFGALRNDLIRLPGAQGLH